MVNFGEVRRTQLAKSTLLSSTLGPWDLPDLLRSAQILERERERARERVGAKSNGKLPHLFIPSKTTIWVPQFVVENLLLGRTL